MWNTNKFNQFATHCLQRTANTNPGNNPLISPLSILSVLFILMDATNGKTREECLKLVKDMISLNDFETLYKNASKALFFSNEIHLQQSILDTIDPSFLKMFQDQYRGKWIPSTQLFELINTTAFQGTWIKPFKDSEKDWFINRDGTKSRCWMMKKVEHTYIENESFTGFMKSYQSGDAFIALLPKEKDYDFLLKNIGKIDFSSLALKAQRYDVDISLPKFEVNFNADLTSLLQNLSIHELFTGRSDLSKMTKTPLKIGKIVHVAKIKVSEKNTIAIAKTHGIAASGMDRYESKSVCLNRPFIYAILHFDGSSQQFIPIFIGILNQL